jgi:MATE family multidrug resistance protein
MAGAVLHNAFRPLDQLFVGYLGRDAQAAIGSVTFVMIFLYGGLLCVASGAGPLVARATGARDEDGRRGVIGQALFAAACLALLMGVAGAFAVGPIVDLLGLTGATAVEARAYLRVILTTGAALALAPTVDACFNAMGETRAPFVLQLANVGGHAILAPLFIFALGLGTSGAALSATVAQTAAASLGVYGLATRVGLRWAHLRPDPKVIAHILRVGAPIGMTTMIYALVYWGLLATSISPLGPSVNAGLGIGFNALEAFAYPAYLGLAIAASSLVGRRLGAGDPADAWRVVRMLTGPSIAFGVVAGVLFLTVGPRVVRLFAADDAVLAEATLYAMILAWSQPFVALETLSEGVLSGAGDTKKVLFATIPFNLLRIPLAWALAFPLGMGAAGVWWAINGTTVLKALTKAALVLHGGWARRELRVGD